jgi:hypothetical protein
VTKAWLLAAAMMVAAPAAANRYVVIAVSDEKGVMVTLDLDSIKTVGAYQRAWGFTVVYAPPSKAIQLQGLTEYDCKGDRTRNLAIRQADADGNFVRDTNKVDEWSFVAPETGESKAFALVCGKNPDPDEVVNLPRTDMVAAFVKNVDGRSKGRK